MTTLQVLRAARAKIDAPEKWTRGAFARDANGTGVPMRGFYADTAVCWCMLGATGSVSENGDDSAADQLLGDAVSQIASGLAVSAFNDAPTTTHADVLAAFDRAIAACEVGS